MVHLSNGLDSSALQDHILPLASVADVKVARIGVEASTEEDKSTSGVPEDVQDQSQLGQLLKHLFGKFNRNNIKVYVPMKNNPKMGVAKYDDEPIFIEWKSLPHHFRSKIIERAKSHTS